MDAAETLGRFAELERRALELYRRFATLYAETPELAALWREMSDIEADHLATLSLADDLVRMAPGGMTVPPSLTPLSVAATQKILEDAEVKAASNGLPAGEAAQLALLLETNELPRITDLLGCLSGRARASVRTGIVATLEGHLECLQRIAAASGRPDVAETARALQAIATTIAQREAAAG